jgi:hypothetical protein
MRVGQTWTGEPRLALFGRVLSINIPATAENAHPFSTLALSWSRDEARAFYKTLSDTIIVRAGST